MAISQERFVKISSSVQDAAIGERDLGGLVFTQGKGWNDATHVLSADEILVCHSLTQVGKYFSTSSTEYKMAAKYFAYVSKSGWSPTSLSFKRMKVTLTRTDGGTSTTKELVWDGSDWKFPGAYGSGTVTLTSTGPATGDTVTVGGTTYTFKTVCDGPNQVRIRGTLADTAAAFADAVNGEGYSGQTANTSVSAAVSEAVVTLTQKERTATTVTLSKSQGASNITVSSWTAGSADTSLQSGETPVVQTMAAALSAVDTTSSNFGSFAFADMTNSTSVSDIKDVANVNAALDTKYLFSLVYTKTTSGAATDVAAIQSWSSQLGGIKGWVGTYGADITSVMVPMAIFAATNYEAKGTATNYMFKQVSGESWTVDTDGLADALDALHFNYYGLTQSNGQKLSFYQRGVMGNGQSGGISVYCNEVWLKSHIATAVMNLFVGVDRIPANEDGAAMLYTTIGGAAVDGVNNGVIEIGKDYTGKEDVIIRLADGDVDAVDMMVNTGYWLNVAIEPDGEAYKAVYRLIYGKGDSVCKVEGSNVLV